ncbi:MAG: hypothetical protein ABIF12_01090 [bacterium]
MDKTPQIEVPETKITKKSYKKTYIIAGTVLILMLSSLILFKYYWPSTTMPIIDEKEDQITIFTHGSFGSVIGLINLFQVLKDNITNTTYKKTISRMRKDPQFYASQPIMQRGLVKIEPSFDLSATSSTRFAAYPILKAYEEVDKQFLSPNTNNHFYTFGWSGLISQERRRKEAIRFYNCLSEELEKYKNKPKIRILAHSHGGNLVLNLAAINKVIKNFNNMPAILGQTINDDEREALFLMYEQIKTLPNQKNSTQTDGQKAFDYRPDQKDLNIDELLMFGTPIQPETETFVLSNFFKKIYNIYSEEDVVQDMDVFSTKKNSSQRLKILESVFIPQSSPQIIQLKIMIDREMKKNENKNEPQTFTLVTTSTQQEESNQSFWGKLFSRNRFGSKKTKDPTHKEMWFVSWDKLQQNLSTPLESIPSVIFTPLFLNAIEKISNQTNDIDINIKLTDKNLKVYVFEHQQEEQTAVHKVSMQRSVVDSIKTSLLNWIPDDTSFTKEFNIIKNYQEQI